MNHSSHPLARVTMLALLLLALALRLLLLDAQSLWYDEGVTAEIARRSLPALTVWTAADIQPPLYYLLVAGWGRLAGWSEWSLRFFSVWWGVLGVPLLAFAAARLTRRPAAGLLAALLAALHPLLVYYSQEARMYALLTTLGVLVACCLIRLAESPQSRPLAATYVLAATAAIYTHYFAFFLLLALGSAFWLDLRRSLPAPEARRAAVNRFLLANLTVLALYLPWFAVLFRRLNEDRSYWRGAFKLGEALRQVLISFSSGETVVERQAVWLLPIYTIITLWAAWRLLRAGPPRSALTEAGRRTALYALLWLILPVAAVLLLATAAPKFNPRYVMLALPGLLLLWAGGLTQPGPGRSARIQAISALAAASLCAGFVYADANWFLNPAFTKDQWRELAAFLRSEREPQEAVALVSGHAWPVWHYYAPDLPAVRLPAIETLEVDAVLDFADAAPPLRAALDPLSDRPGVWLIGWQDRVVDPTGVLPVALEIAGREKGLSTRFWGLTLRRFSRLKTSWLPEAAPIEHTLDIDLGGGLRLAGVTVLDNGDLLLFWQRSAASESSDYHLHLASTDAAGQLVATIEGQRLAGYDYPSFRWPTGKTVMGRIAAADWLGADPQPGRYRAQMSVYDAAAGRGDMLTTADGQSTIVLEPLEVEFE